jgi:alcohol dehydrogenase YqhD (iron-dependent ADH family)
MDNFVFYSPTRFVFGRNTETQVGELVKSYGGKKVLIHYGGGSVVRSGLLERVIKSLDEAAIAHVELGGVKPNPRSDLVYEGIDFARKEGVDFILAVGGGSVIDSAKAIALGVVYDGDFADYYFGKETKNPKAVPASLPIGTVLTIAAAGSEGSPNSVITLEGDLKRACTGEVLRPKFSILNPELTLTLPLYQVACGLTDMFAHVVERYFTPTSNVAITDEMCEAIMRTIVLEGEKAIASPEDYDARANVMWAGTVAHNNVCGVGRVQDWSSHAIEHELSALYDCAHGAGLAVIMPAWMEYVMETDIARFARFAERVFGVNEPDSVKAANAGIAAFRNWLRKIGMPLSFSELGAKAEDIPFLVKKLNLSGNTLGSFRPLKDEDVAEIYKLACIEH